MSRVGFLQSEEVKVKMALGAIADKLILSLFYPILGRPFVVPIFPKWSIDLNW